MGVWGVGPFENDVACDWAYGLESTTSLHYIEESITRVLSEGAGDESSAMEALAACETLARLLGNRGERTVYTEVVDKWVDAKPTVPSKFLLQMANQALDLLVDKDSGLRQLWEDAGEEGEWLRMVDGVRGRLVRS